MSKSIFICAFALFFAASIVQARARHAKDETQTIAVGPSAGAEEYEGDDVVTDSGPSNDDAIDNVDKPLPRANVISTEAPAVTPSVAPSAAVTTSPSPASAPVAEAKKSTPQSKPVPKQKAEIEVDEAAADETEDAITKAGQAVAAPAPESDSASRLKVSGSKVSGKKLTAKVAAKPAASNGTKSSRDESKAGVTPSAAPTEASDSVNAEQSLKWLENGNTRYVTKKFRADGKLPADRTKEPKPHAIVLSCSDSRVPPELIFDQGLGEIITIRVAAEVLDTSVVASIEQAIQTYHPHLLVVLGHTQCESIEAVMTWKDKTTYGSDALDRMVSEIKPHLKTLASGTRSPGLQVEAALQADGVARELAERSEIVKKAVDSKELTIKTGLYWLDTGKVKFY